MNSSETESGSGDGANQARPSDRFAVKLGHGVVVVGAVVTAGPLLLLTTALVALGISTSHESPLLSALLASLLLMLVTGLLMLLVTALAQGASWSFRRHRALIRAVAFGSFVIFAAMSIVAGAGDTLDMVPVGIGALGLAAFLTSLIVLRVMYGPLAAVATAAALLVASLLWAS